MQANRERWEELCQQATVEQDSNKLVQLVQEINRLLGEKQERLKNARMNGTPAEQIGGNGNVKQ